MNNRGFGTLGELKAKEYLEAMGYKWLHSNFRTSLGEIDLIFRDGNELVFVEVKTARAGVPKEYLYYRVNREKVSKLHILAQNYIQRSPKSLGTLNPRFDILFIESTAENTWNLEHIKGAF